MSPQVFAQMEPAWLAVLAASFSFRALVATHKTAAGTPWILSAE
jgi:hypothetical protein